MLSLIQLACEKGQRDCYAWGKKNSHNVDKIRITFESVRSIVHQREHPWGLTRRFDFVPYSDFRPQSVDPDLLFQACFGDNHIDWLTRASPLPPVQMWAGHDMSSFNLETLVALFCRALRDDCCTSIQLGHVNAVYEARATSPGLLRLMNPDSWSKASVHKGRLVWVAEDSKLEERFDAQPQPHHHEHPGSLRGFHENFAVGTLHIVQAMDVTNSKMQIYPKLCLPVLESEAEAATRAEPEAEQQLPGARTEGIATYIRQATHFCTVPVV